MSDYIKREDAIKRILQQCDNDCLYCMFNWQNDNGDYCAVKDCFADIPSADVVERKAFDKLREYRVDEYLKNEVAKRKRGEWIDNGTIGWIDKERVMTCSICGQTIYDNGRCNNLTSTDWNFCPNCGAEMEQ